MRSRILIVPALLWLASVYAAQPQADAAMVSANVKALLQGRFDNRQQVAKAPSNVEHPIPHVTVVIEPTSKPDWSLWHVHVDTDAESSYDQTWAMRTGVEHDGSGALIPYYQLKQTSVPDAATFNPQDWLSLEACALRGNFTKARIQACPRANPAWPSP